MGILAPKDLRQWPSERECMPLLRSLADRAARVAINMALLKELNPSQSPKMRVRCSVIGRSRLRPTQHVEKLRDPTAGGRCCSRGRAHSGGTARMRQPGRGGSV